MSLPAFFSTTPDASTRRSTLTSFFSRSSSVSGMRAIRMPPVNNLLARSYTDIVCCSNPVAG